MKTLSDLFHIVVARSRGIDDYAKGNVPFVTSAELRNGVVSYVATEPGDRVFTGPALVISGLGFATVQLGQFLPKGNGGDSLTVMKPKSAMTVDQLISTAAAFNVLHRWRFGFGRKVSVGRLLWLEVPEPTGTDTAPIWQKGSENVQELSDQLSDMLALPVPPFDADELAVLVGGDNATDDDDDDGTSTAPT